jgi:hypothetical protein
MRRDKADWVTQRTSAAREKFFHSAMAKRSSNHLICMPVLQAMSQECKRSRPGQAWLFTNYSKSAWG